MLFFFTILLIMLSIICLSLFYFNKMCAYTINQLEGQKIRYKLYYDITNKWIKNKNKSNLIGQYLVNRKMKNVVIYGVGELGERLYEELKPSKINVLYFIDRNASYGDMTEDNIFVMNLNNIKYKEKIDAVIITPIYAFEAIEKSLTDIGINSSIIIGLDEIINEI